MVWSTVTIRDYLVKTELRDPTRRPRDRFFYVDVSSVDNHVFAIRQPTELLGADAPSRARKVIREHDVLFATVRPTLRRIALVDSALDNQICSTGFCVLRPGAKLDARFLYYWLLTDDVLDHVAKIEKGVSYPAIRDSDVKAIRIPCPQLDEQRQIAAVLSAVRRTIGRQERLIALTAELKKALMHKLFTEGSRGERLKQTEIGPLPESWSVATIGELFKFSSGKSRPKDTEETWSEEKPYPVFGGNGVMGFAPERLLDHPALVIGRVGVYCGCAHHTDGAAWISDNALYATWVDVRIHTRYAREFFEFANLNKHSSRAAQPLVTQGILSGIQMPLPPEEEQRRIQSALAALAAKIDRHRRAHDLLNSLFRTLLHKLMTAEIRVHDLDLSALEGVEQEPVGAV